MAAATTPAAVKKRCVCMALAQRSTLKRKSRPDTYRLKNHEKNLATPYKIKIKTKAEITCAAGTFQCSGINGIFCTYSSIKFIPAPCLLKSYYN